jgi:hypothetical protein
MTSLSSCSWLTVCHELVIELAFLLDFRDNLELVWVVDDELPGLTFERSNVAVRYSRNDLALAGHSRYFIVVLLYN